MGNQNRYDYPWISGDASFGELVTSDKLRALTSYPRDTLLDLLGDVYRGYSEVKRSAVIAGLAPSLPGGLDVTIQRGLALSYSPVLDVTGLLAIRPVVVETVFTLTLAARPGANSRYDLVVLRPNSVLADYALRQTMDSSGVKSTQNLPGKWDEGYSYYVYQGVAAAFPVVIPGAIGEVPVAVIEVPAGAAPLVLHDIRSFLRPRVGGKSAYQFTATLAAGAVGALVEVVTDPTIRVFQSITKVGATVGAYLFQLTWPLVQGTHPSELFGTSTMPVMSVNVARAIGVGPPFGNSYNCQNGYLVAGMGIGGWDVNVWDGLMLYIEVQDNAAAFAPIDLTGRISGEVALLPTD